jgi:hypothetical protein
MLGFVAASALAKIDPKKSGAWSLNGTWPFGHWADHGLADAIGCLVGQGTLLDIGAGVGEYGVHFSGCKPAARPRWSGIDGTPNVASLAAQGPGSPVVREYDFCNKDSETILAAQMHPKLRPCAHKAQPSWHRPLLGTPRPAGSRPRLPKIKGRGHRSACATCRFDLSGPLPTMHLQLLCVCVCDIRAFTVAPHGFEVDHNATKEMYRGCSLHYVGVNTQVFRPVRFLRVMEQQTLEPDAATSDIRRCWRSQRKSCAKGLGQSEGGTDSVVTMSSMCGCTAACSCPTALRRTPSPLS